ncbi:hypothetical protein Pmar_PMAR014762, partial [Perkinsus marinus ATCC 50983]
LNLTHFLLLLRPGWVWIHYKRSSRGRLKAFGAPLVSVMRSGTRGCRLLESTSERSTAMLLRRRRSALMLSRGVLKICARK